MTWFLAIIGLAFTWYNLIPDYQYINEYTLEYEINYQEYQKELITEWFFEFAEALGKYHYARWCAGGYEPSSWSEEKQKRLKCSAKSFDCWWVIKAYWFIEWILTKKEIWIYNSKSLYDLWDPISPFIAQRWDYTYWELVSWSWIAATHWAFVSSGMIWNTITIFDWLWWMFNDRDLILHCTEKNCVYNTTRWRYKIYFSSNPLYKLAQERDIEIKPFIKTSSNTWSVDWLDKTYRTNSENPLWFYIVLDWYAYDSEANRIINRWYVRNNDLDMIATYVCENQWFDPTVVSDTNDRWLCQLNYRYNKIFINDPNRLDINFQKQVCLDKWNLVKDKNLWSCYSKRDIYLDKIKNVDDWYRSIGDH